MRGAVPAGRANGEVVSRSVCGHGSVPAARDREISDARHTKKIIGKPCAGKPHARFDEGGRRMPASYSTPFIHQATGFSGGV